MEERKYWIQEQEVISTPPMTPERGGNPQNNEYTNKLAPDLESPPKFKGTGNK